MKTPRTPSSSSDQRLVELLKSDVTKSWARTCRAVAIIVIWPLRWWPVTIPVGVIVWLIR